MRQRVRLKASRKNGLVVTVSARALNVASFISFSGLLHHLGTKPQPHGNEGSPTSRHVRPRQGGKVLLLTIECVLKEDTDPSIGWA